MYVHLHCIRVARVLSTSSSMGELRKGTGWRGRSVGRSVGPASHFQVGFRPHRRCRPLEGTSNASDIAAREFKSPTPSAFPVYPPWRLGAGRLLYY